MATASPPTLSRLTGDLKASLQNEKARNLNTLKLKEYVTLTSRELSGEDLTKFYGEVNSTIRTLVQSVDNDDKLCGALIIDTLIGVEDEDNTAQETRFANYLRQLFPSDVPTMTVAARALGKLAQQRGLFTADFVEFELTRAIEWMAGDRQEARRHASVLILAELARHANVIVYPHVGTILNNIWGAMREPKQAIREAAADTLSAVLVLIADRVTSQNQQTVSWYNRIHDEAQRGLRIASTESIHGSLLIFRELTLHANMYIYEKFRDTCDTVLRLKDHRDSLIRRTVMHLLPVLAAYDPSDFMVFYMDRSMSHLLGQIQVDKEWKAANDADRSIAFQAIGKLALVAKRDMEEYLSEAIHCIKEGLRAKNKPRIASSESIFGCISMLAQAVGQSMGFYLSELLDLMLATGLSEAMCQSLTDLSIYIPHSLSGIQERLLNTISLILSGSVYRDPGAPKPKKTVLTKSSSYYQEARNPETIMLALKTLGSFNFSEHRLNEFVRDSCIIYLDDENAGIRRAAAQTCCQLFARDPIVFQTSTHAVQVVGEVLEKLLLVGIADPESSIRRTILTSLDERFDHHLAKAENVRSLFIALNDEKFDIRELAITILGRITKFNPAYVIPHLRKILIQLLTEIEYSGLTRNKEESARLLTLLVMASQTLVKPYIETVLKVLLPNIRDSSPGVVSSVLEALGEIAQVGGEDLLPYMDQLMPMFIEVLQDQSSPVKRSAALTSLGRLASNTGYVIDPYLKYPVLLDILMSILKTEQSVRIRQETIKLVGVLGALDPYRHKQMVMKSGDQNQADKAENADVALLMTGLEPSSDEYYPSVVIGALLKILKDPSLGQQYQPATQAILNIFRSLQLKVVGFLPQIMPVYLGIMQSGTVQNLDFYFEKMGVLVQIVTLHIRPYIPDLLKLIEDNWSRTRLQERVVGLIESVAISLDGEYKSYMPKLLRSMLAVLDSDISEKRGASHRVLQAFVRLGSNVEEFMHLIIPALVKTFEKTDAPMNLRRAAISTVGALSRRIDFSDYASRIVLPLVRNLASPGQELRNVTMDVLCLLVVQLKQDYVGFVPLVRKIVIRERINHPNYNLVVTKLINREPLPSASELTGLGDDRYVVATDVPQALSDSRKLPVNPIALRRAWDTTSRSTKEDWTDWIRRLTLEMLKETPSHSLRACADMANSFPPLARELFNCAFMSCWMSLTEQFQDEFAEAIKTALVAKNISPEITQTLLNLAEYMEHDDKPLPIETSTLGKYARGCHAYAKALHYNELQFMKDHSTSIIESLIGINNHLQQSDSAAGMLTYAQRHHDIELKESWYERLHRWEDALAAYERKQIENPNDLLLTLGRMRCLHALGEWSPLSKLGQEKWSLAPPDFRRGMAPFVAAAAWGLGQWELLDDYVSVMQEESPDRAFFKAVLSLHRNEFAMAEKLIEHTRTLLDTELTALVSESYSRAYNTVVRVQMMAELEEIISYKRYEGQPDRQATIRKTWMKRLLGCERNLEIWQKVIKVHAMALTPSEDMDLRIKFTNLCRKSGRLRLADKALTALMGRETAEMSFTQMIQVTPPQVVYAKLKCMWAAGIREQTLECLRQFTDRLASDLGLGTIGSNGTALTGVNRTHGSEEDFSRLLARCYLKQGEWQFAMQDGWTAESIEYILLPYSNAKNLDKNWYKAWHTWALANFNVISFYERNGASGATQGLPYVIPSVKGFFRSIALSAGNSLQDTLRLLTLWFKFGHRADVSAALAKDFPTVNIDTWLQVIPQLIARIHAPSQNVHRLIHQLLADVGKAHPQALVYSLTVASKSPSVFRKDAALAIMEKMRLHSPALVDQASLVSQELLRVAILWHEMWQDGLEEALTLNSQGGRSNIDTILDVLEPLHQMILKRPETHHEASFAKAFGRDLEEAFKCCTRFRQKQDMGELNQAWDIYLQVYNRIKKLPFLSTLELPYVSPQLQNARDLELAIPGTYKSGEPVIRISSFNHVLTVLNTKQKPRKLTVNGSDGREYAFLLKGHEDLRQDERVMQLFGLVNTLLATDPETFKRHLNIIQYSVIPLSPNSGLIGWLPETDTLHNLIREYRESRKLSFYIEHQLLTQMAPPSEGSKGYDSLTVMQKVEVFENMLDNTKGDDLYKILWLKSRNSEVWFERRTNFTRSLAVMSMAGHILGLGDRHPSNMMMDRNTGRIVHIDFGDCFEVAMHRPQFPERIPFRLTRMLVQAMEVSGIEGSFRNTSENVMRVLRENKESLMAVLEAFVHDPLINWRILNTSPRQQTNAPQARNGTINESFIADQARSLRRPLPSEQQLVSDNVEVNAQPEQQLNQRAVTILTRVTNKLTGRDFHPDVTLDVPSQVEKLIRQATSTENLCQCWVGYCAFW
ncbi:phosphatidylinositol kinase- protein kinase tor1 [Mortierella sp. AD011]|nr:phosphatidylinositol kinase- protein kinase tor1 [Mortierella sp. AD010]KAF9399518.1 phosphatidylinositol kinase- protein kinase tor1 [Mortierella sp. AD011]